MTGSVLNTCAAPPGLRTVELTAAWAPQLQRFFERNPEYFLGVNGEPPRADEGLEEIREMPPAEFTYRAKHMPAWLDADGEMAAMSTVIVDLCAESVWHVGLFIVATARHGSGDAQRLFAALQSWAAAGGARWLRLGVVKGNTRAERFWTRMGFTQVHVREGVRMGQRENDIRVMFKPLAGGTRQQYLDLVARDRS